MWSWVRAPWWVFWNNFEKHNTCYTRSWVARSGEHPSHAAGHSNATAGPLCSGAGMLFAWEHLMRPWCEVWDSSPIASLARRVTVAILAQGTSWAVAATAQRPNHQPMRTVFYQCSCCRRALNEHFLKCPSETRLGAVPLKLCSKARLAQSAERKALNLVVVGSSPTVGVCANAFQNGG